MELYSCFLVTPISVPVALLAKSYAPQLGNSFPSPQGLQQLRRTPNTAPPESIAGILLGNVI